jgi:hypothetical protein
MPNLSNALLIRFWFECKRQYKLGAGVTAYSKAYAVKLLSDSGLIEGRDFDLERCTQDVDIRDLDQNHVVPNMGPPNLRGVWYPWFGHLLD